jgi:hypothetical protein
MVAIAVATQRAAYVLHNYTVIQCASVTASTTLGTLGTSEVHLYLSLWIYFYSL